MNITRNELLELLKGIEKSTFVNLVTETPVGMNKKNNPYFEKVIKRSKCNYLIGNDYESRVNSNEKKEGLEGTFETEKASGKHHISKCVLQKDTDENVHYLMVERFVEIKPQVEYIFEGNQIEKSLFESFMKKTYESKKQVQERKVIVNTPLISNIKEISIGKEKYVVVD